MSKDKKDYAPKVSIEPFELKTAPDPFWELRMEENPKARAVIEQGRNQKYCHTASHYFINGVHPDCLCHNCKYRVSRLLKIDSHCGPKIRKVVKENGTFKLKVERDREYSHIDEDKTPDLGKDYDIPVCEEQMD